MAMEPPVYTVSPPPHLLQSSDLNMALGSKEDSLVNGDTTASDVKVKKHDAVMKFWSDSILLNTFLETSNLRNPSSYEENLIMRMYLRWYMGFEMGSINPAELVCQMALLTPSSRKDKPLFEDVFRLTKFDGITFPSKTRRTLIPVRNVRLPELSPSMLNSYYNYKSSESNSKEQLIELGEKEKSAIYSFYSFAKSTLSITEKNNFNRITLKRYLSFSALVTLRLICKQTSSVQTFLKERFCKMLQHFYNGFYGELWMCAPHLKSLGDVKRGLDLRLPNIKITLHAIILQYTIHERSSDVLKVYDSFMLYSLLLCLELYGMPLVRLYLRLVKFDNDPINWNNEYVIRTEKFASFTLISNLIKQYSRLGGNQISWRWCRLLDDNYFAEFKIESNALAYYMATLLTSMNTSNNDIWNMVGFKNNLNIDMKKEADICCKSVMLTRKLERKKELQSLISNYYKSLISPTINT